MNGPKSSTSPRRFVLPAVILACVLALLGAGSALGAEAVTYTHESVQEYEQQLAHNEIVSATFNKRVRNLHLTLKDGTHVLVHYPPKDEPTLLAALQAKHVPVTILTPAEAKSEASKPAVHHKLRYIAGGILLVVIIIVGAVLLFDRRRKSMAE
jgi:hypothetical protein